MKIKRTIAISVISIFCSLIPAAVHAEGTPVSTFSELQSIANDGGEAIIQTDLNMTGNVIARNDLIIDLNGHTITNTTTNRLLVSYSKITIKDSSAGKSGKILAPNSETWAILCGDEDHLGDCVIDSGSIDAAGYGAKVFGNFTMNGGSFKIAKYYAITAMDNTKTIINDGYIEAADNPTIKVQGVAEITVNGGKIVNTGYGDALSLDDGAVGTINGGEFEGMYIRNARSGGSAVTVWNDSTVKIYDGTFKSYSHTVATNGTIEPGKQDGRNAKIYIYGGTFSSVIGDCLYLPSANGITEIHGGTFTSGNTAVEVRAGSFYIKDGVFTSTATEYSVDADRSGSTTKGAALAIAQHRTMQPISFEICGGNFFGPVAVSEANPEGNPPEAINDIQIGINRTCSEPIFESTTDQTVIVEDVTEFIEGGTFSNDIPMEYVVKGSGKKDGGTGKIVVYPIRKITVLSAENGSIATDRNNAMHGDKITLTSEIAEHYQLKQIKVVGDTTGKEYEVSNLSSFIMPDEDVTISAVIEEVIENPQTDDQSYFYVNLLLNSAAVLAVLYFTKNAKISLK